MKTAKEIVSEIISTIEPLKVTMAKTKPEKFVNVGIEAVKRLLTDNHELVEATIRNYAMQVAEAIRDECIKESWSGGIDKIDLTTFIK